MIHISENRGKKKISRFPFTEKCVRLSKNEGLINFHRGGQNVPKIC